MKVLKNGHWSIHTNEKRKPCVSSGLIIIEIDSVDYGSISLICMSSPWLDILCQCSVTTIANVDLGVEKKYLEFLGFRMVV